MSNIDPSQQSLSAILNKLGINSSEKSNVPKAKDQLGQEDFLKLMTTQLQNQDPFAPMENGEFIAQMAQFSTVTGITSMDESLKNVAAKLGETRIATAANMLGHSVLVPGKIARADDDGSVNGVIDLPSASTNVNDLAAPSVETVISIFWPGFTKGGSSAVIITDAAFLPFKDPESVDSPS